ncbi:DNA recombination protein RmuC [Mucilaginibacter sp. RS28]|uniref:DNA recombination protein RmuC n=1 Tax=Mucilaginibacter straminoryzae TaxID=2932774 RepID=A0A9X2B9G8_9SPHI|nr:DNA recombination protein RmuC [Mucilaginibacter straminoryzae]MCJ8210614.1 DNA recombination protein RmuC [Mucilaginibacter straminoryzae]
MDVAILLAGIVLLLVSVYLFIKSKSKSSATESAVKQENEQLKIQLARAEEKSQWIVAEKENITALYKEEQQRLQHELSHERIKLSEALQAIERSEAYQHSQQEKLQEQKAELEQTRLRFHREFEAIAEKLLKEKSREFTDTNRTNLDTMLNPLKENLKTFEEKVDKVYQMEAAERNTLKGVITQLMELNRQISNEAQNLTKALKGDTKKQGNWGEFILEKVLERSGLVKDREYRLQASYQNQDGSRYQPDAIIDLPDQKHLVVDAKVSLVAYEKLVNCETDEERKLYARAHVESLRNHIQGLAAKNYHDLRQLNCPEFVMLFVPIESSFSIAVQLDTELFTDAWDKRVVIVSPSTLLATLRTIASMWKQENQNRNVMEIARLSGEMYDKFAGFVGDLESIGKNLRQSQDAYDKAFNKLVDGRGNLTITAEKIKKLGAKANKQLDNRYVTEE